MVDLGSGRPESHVQSHAGAVVDAPCVAIVVPALNEEESLPKTLAAMREQQPPASDVVVVDPGSEDRTAEVAITNGARVVSAPRGRSKQMNVGAKVAQGEVLLFLHADTLLPAGALKQIQDALTDSSVMGGCFRLRFMDDERDLALQFYSWCTRTWLFRTPRLVFGDRGIFVRRSAFEALGGFNEWPILEDVDFAMRLSWLGKRAFAFLPMTVLTSPRRFVANGSVRQMLLDTAIMCSWYLGLPLSKICKWYAYVYKKPAAASSPAAGMPPSAAGERLS